MGGSDRIENLVLACEPCNQARGGLHGPGAHKPGSPSYKPNGHERFVQGTIHDPPPREPHVYPPSKVKTPVPKVTAPDVSEGAADAFVQAIENRQMEKALQRLQAKYGSAFKYVEKKEDHG